MQGIDVFLRMEPRASPEEVDQVSLGVEKEKRRGERLTRKSLKDRYVQGIDDILPDREGPLQGGEQGQAQVTGRVKGEED